MYVFIFSMKEKEIESIKTSKDEQWIWIGSNPERINDYIWNGEVLSALLQRTVSLCIMNLLPSLEIEGGTSLLHVLSYDPANEDQMSSLMDLFQEGFDPNKKDELGYTFLELRPAEAKLSVAIYRVLYAKNMLYFILRKQILEA